MVNMQNFNISNNLELLIQQLLCLKFIFHPGECVVFPDRWTCSAKDLEPFMLPEYWQWNRKWDGQWWWGRLGFVGPGYSQQYDVNSGWTSKARPKVSTHVRPREVITGSQTKRHHGDHMTTADYHRDPLALIYLFLEIWTSAHITRNKTALSCAENTLETFRYGKPQITLMTDAQSSIAI